MDLLKKLNREARKIARSQLSKVGLEEFVLEDDAPTLIDVFQDVVNTKPEEIKYDPVPSECIQLLKEACELYCGTAEKPLAACLRWLEHRPEVILEQKRNAEFSVSCDEAIARAEIYHILEELGVLCAPPRSATRFIQAVQRISVVTERPVYNLIALAYQQIANDIPFCDHDNVDALLNDAEGDVLPEFLDALNDKLRVGNVKIVRVNQFIALINCEE